jgi:tryptophanyl-tRNA synthetase
MDIFIQIDDIAHQEINEDPDENPFTTKELKDEFYKIDDKYHNTKDMDIKYAAEKEMVDLLEKAEENRPEVKDDENKDLEKDIRYKELLEQFNEIR